MAKEEEMRPCATCGCMFHHQSFSSSKPRKTCSLVCRYKLQKKKLLSADDRGRSLKHIDWKKVDELLLSGCTGLEVASYFDMHQKTFYDRVAVEKGLTFTEYASGKKAKGESILRAQQYAKALGASKHGDNTLLIWLGKQRLGQRDNPSEEFSIEDQNKLMMALDIVDYLKKKSEGVQSSDSTLSQGNSDLKIDDKSINSDT